MRGRPQPAIPIARHFFESLSFQLLGIFAASTILPLSVAVAQPGVLQNGRPYVVASAVSSFAAALGSLLLYRRVTAFPGSRGFAYIIPAFSVAYGIVVALFLGLRLPYSGLVLTIGFSASTSFGFLAHHSAQKLARRRFYLVPYGDLGIVKEAPDIEWIILSSADFSIADPHGAIVADLRHDYPPEWERMLAQAAVSGRIVYHTKQLRESLTGRVQIDHLSENSFGSLLPNLAYRKIKRAVDVCVSLALLPFLLPPMFLAGIAVKLDSPGPVFFSQMRMGYRGRPFRVLKFRTMRHERCSLDERNAAMTGDQDPRITRVGRFLRRSRVDELPQLLNVLRGEMSLIGPRPEAIPLSQWYESELPFYVYRHIVRPGVTGWAQVNQGHVTGLDQVNVKLNYDFYYIKNFSAWLDVLIAIRTIGIVLSGFGAR